MVSKEKLIEDDRSKRPLEWRFKALTGEIQNDFFWARKRTKATVKYPQNLPNTCENTNQRTKSGETIKQRNDGTLRPIASLAIFIFIVVRKAWRSFSVTTVFVNKIALLGSKEFCNYG